MSDDRFARLKAWAAKLMGDATPSNVGTPAPAKALTPSPAPVAPPVSVKPSVPSPPEAGGTLNAEGMVSSRAPLLDLCLGIDFGTRFTKVGVGSRTLQRREVLALRPDNDRLVASVLYRDSCGLFYPPDLPCPSAAATVSYLKMRMADPDSASFEGHEAATSFNVDQFEALAAFYVAGIMRMSREAARGHFNVSPTRSIQWSCNVGVPVKYCDGEVVDRFKRMARAAWDWSNNAAEPIDFASLAAAYRERQDLPDPGSVDVAPELTATLAAFGEDPNTAEGLYALLDIGGGTVDGSVFEISKSGRVKLRIIESNVASLGTVAVARHMAASSGSSVEAIEKTLLFSPSAAAFGNDSEVAKLLQKLAFQLVAKSRKKRGEQLFSHTIYRTALERPRYPEQLPAHPDVPLLLSGGGAHSKWYQTQLAATGQQFSLSSFAIGDFKVHVLPRAPRDRTVDHHRFVVALGLANANLFLTDYQLPSALPTLEALPERTLPTDAPYSKDLI